MKRKGERNGYRGSEVMKKWVTEDEEKGQMKGLQREWSNKRMSYRGWRERANERFTEGLK